MSEIPQGDKFSYCFKFITALCGDKALEVISGKQVSWFKLFWEINTDGKIGTICFWLRAQAWCKHEVAYSRETKKDEVESNEVIFSKQANMTQQGIKSIRQKQTPLENM